MMILTAHISNVYAIDFADHTGYTPSWAQSMGSYQALDRCNGIAGENSADGNWCMEWVASAIDQGDSTSQSVHPTTNMVERICTTDIVCAFPGEFLKYTGSYHDGFDHQNHPSFTTANFGQTVENNKILVQIDMTGSKPETDILDMQTGTLSNDQYNNTNQGFGYIESIPVAKSLYKDNSMCSFGADCKITFEKMNVKGMTRTILVSHLDNGDGTFLENRYDNDTGVWLAGIQTVKDNGQIFTNELHLVDSNIYDHPTIVVPSNIQPKSESGVIPDQAKIITKSWIEGSITDNEFLQKIQQLLDSGQMVIPYPSPKTWASIKALEGVNWVDFSKSSLASWVNGNPDQNYAVESFQDLIAAKYLTEKSWGNESSTNQNSTIQDIQQSNLNTTSNDQTNQVRNTSSSITPTISNNNNVKMDPASIAAGFFIILGLPAIIIFVIVWKLRKYLAKRRNNKLEAGT